MDLIEFVEDIFLPLALMVGILLRTLGMLVFGVGAGWFTLTAVKMSDAWQLSIAIYLGFFGLVGALTRFMGASPGGLGAFVLGAGAALLLFGLRKPSEEE